MSEENIQESGHQSNTICSSCGLPFNSIELELSYKNTFLNKEFIFCSSCTLNNKNKPIFTAVVAALALGYFIEKRGFKNPHIALQKAWNTVIEFPYWKVFGNECNSISNLQKSFNLDASGVRIFSLLYSKIRDSNDVIFFKDEYDIFISHSWKGPDVELVDPLVDALRNLGYSVWYDKDRGLKPGNLEDFLKNAIYESRNCIPIICREYFKGNNTRFELKNILNFKEIKHIIPIWWSDVDKDFLKSQKVMGDKILKSTGVVWDNYHGNINILAKILDDYLIASEDLEIFNGVKVYESEAHAMNSLEFVIGEKIPLMNQNDNLHSGFQVENMHITSLNLTRTNSDIERSPIRLPDLFRKLKNLKFFSAPLIEVPDYFDTFLELIHLDLHGGLLQYIPDNLLNLKKLSFFNIVGNPLNNVINGRGQMFLEKWMKQKKIYVNLSPYEGLCLFLLQCAFGWKNEIPEMDENRENPMGYMIHDGKMKILKLQNTKIPVMPNVISCFTFLQGLAIINCELKSLPNTIGELKSLIALNLERNELEMLPDSIGNLIILKKLNLGSNKLIELPHSIGNLKSLNELYLWDNNLTYLPNFIMNLNSLVVFKCDIGENLEINDAIKEWMKSISDKIMYIDRDDIDINII